jgi:serine/threonine-protein kinase
VFALIELDARDMAKKFLDLPYPRIFAIRDALKPLKATQLPKEMGKWECRCLHFRMREALQNGNFEPIEAIYKKLADCKISKAHRLHFDAIEAWRTLLLKDFAGASTLFKKYPAATLIQETSPLHFPFGAWLYLKEGPKSGSAHFGAVLDTPYPPTTALPSHFLAGRIDEKKGWIQRAFWWEKKELHRQLDLFHRAVGKKVSHEKTER